MKAIVDKVVDIFISKKLTVFVVGTLFLYLGKLSGVQWVNLAMVYVGTQGVIDAIIKLRNGNK
jgi:hypothetical protein